ncbi:MAG: TonB-dependent receptor [Flavobacteriaceae bacterium]|nr:TonB-dependent receptor [Flavobacteriaceae bacterium]
MKKQRIKKIKQCLLLILFMQFTIVGMAQDTVKVNGKVLSDFDNGELIGASIIEKGTSNGVVVDFDGNYTITVSNDAILIFSYTGMISQEITVGNKTVIDVLLKSSGALDEIVLTGYGTQKRRNITGSVASVNAEELKQASVATFDQMLQGKVSGVQISQTSGGPGGNVNVLIRGASSITGGNQPLYVIDGFALSTGSGGDFRNFNSAVISTGALVNRAGGNRVNPLASINPADILSIEVLKDASATAIYGSRGSNGVILITTKRGNYGKAKVSLNVSSGIQTIANKLDLMNAQEYMQFVVDGRDARHVFLGGNANDPDNTRPAAAQVPDGFRDGSITIDTDWQDLIFEAAPVTDIQLSVTGGDAKTKYYVSGGYFNQDGIIKTTTFKRFNFRSNLDIAISDKVKFGTSIAASHSSGRFPQVENHYATGGVLSQVLSAAPTLPAYDENGNPYFEGIDGGNAFFANPLTLLNDFSDKRKNTEMFINTFLEWKITENLKFKTTLGVNYASRAIQIFRTSNIPFFGIRPSTAASINSQNLNWLNENTLSYNKLFGDKHSVDAVVGFTVQKDNWEQLSAAASAFPTDEIKVISAGVVDAGRQSISEWSLLSLLARANYSYDNRYLLTATIRRDGSSRFGSKNRWGLFPSFSAGWNVSNEAFMESVDFLDNFKIRYSYGEAGNNLIGNYATQGILGFNNYVQNGSQVIGLVPNTLPNDQLTWERSKQHNFGLDFTILNNRITFSGDIYKDTKEDLLLAVQLPAASGYSSSTQNVGTVENRGVEFSIQTDNIITDNFRWSSNVIFSKNENKVLKLAREGEKIFISSRGGATVQIVQEGYPLASFYMLKAIGVYATDADVVGTPVLNGNVAAGDLIFDDFNGDGVINDNDLQVVGNPFPDFVWGFTNTFTYKNFDLSILINGQEGADVFYLSGGINLNSAGVQNQLAIATQRWRSPTEPGNGVIPRSIRVNHGRGISTTSRYVYDASYVRLNNVNLSYRLSDQLVKKMSLSGVTFSLSGQNLKTWTDYPGFDPEAATSGNSVSGAGIDDYAYPLATTITLGVNLTF